jgi:hypothetical protein
MTMLQSHLAESAEAFVLSALAQTPSIGSYAISLILVLHTVHLQASDCSAK